MSKRRKVLGDAWVDKGSPTCNAFNTEFQELITRYAFGEIYHAFREAVGIVEELGLLKR
jgi:hypothetical protein